MESNLKRVKAVFSSPVYKSIHRWMKPFRLPICAISLLGISGTALSLCMTMVTKELIDGATSHDSSLLWKYGILLVAIIAIERGIISADKDVGTDAAGDAATGNRKPDEQGVSGFETIPQR